MNLENSHRINYSTNAKRDRILIRGYEFRSDSFKLIGRENQPRDWIFIVSATSLDHFNG